jgi:urease accessory protein
MRNRIAARLAHESPAVATVHERAAPSTEPGTGRLRFTRVGERTVVSRAFAASPLKLLTPANAGRAAWVYLSTYGGGLVDGDRLRLSVEVDVGAVAWLATQASTKVYRSSSGTTSHLSARVASGGLLVVAPDPVVCYAGAAYLQEQAVDLEDDAALVLVDWLTAGRRACGERWQFDRYDSRLTIRVGGRRVLYDALRLHSADGDLSARLGRFDVVAFVAVIGAPLSRHADAIVSRVANQSAEPGPRQLEAAASVGPHGCLLRLAGVSVEDVGRSIRDALAFLPTILGDDPWSRKW